MDRKIFFDHVRKAPFGSLSQGQVDGLNVLLDTWHELYPDADPRWIANSLSQIYRETGGRMQAVREAFAGSDEAAIRALDRAWKKGQLTWVKTPYWREGWFGRGHIQLTHKRNYERLGKRLGVDLISNPSLALDPHVSSKIAIVGMVEGLFTGKKLSDYFSANRDDPRGARRIVNGPDGTEGLIERMHNQFLKALEAAGYVPGRVVPPTPIKAPEEPSEPQETPTEEPTKPDTVGILIKVVKWLFRLFLKSRAS